MDMFGDCRRTGFSQGADCWGATGGEPCMRRLCMLLVTFWGEMSLYTLPEALSTKDVTPSLYW